MVCQFSDKNRNAQFFVAVDFFTGGATILSVNPDRLAGRKELEKRHRKLCVSGHTADHNRVES